jgi:hypothetical protein
MIKLHLSEYTCSALHLLTTMIFERLAETHRSAKMRGILPFLRPSSLETSRPIFTKAYARYYSRLLGTSAPGCGEEHECSSTSVIKGSRTSERLQDLGIAREELYPRISYGGRKISIRSFLQTYQHLETSELLQQPKEVVLHGKYTTFSEYVKLNMVGRVSSIRLAGSKLAFFDLVQDGQRVQGLCNLGLLSHTGVTPQEYKRFYQKLRRGDVVSMRQIFLGVTLPALNLIF